ncbi:NAD-dependent epimerase/dehydratase family protein [Pseudalkalibacillus caeni]|uniref:NAD-dependent epimerase/dehydratase family protein n=1 Tax=Exobacillus caeni TaxID=2574798 RepID=A0A5R9F380_9BACL|nr:NAD-dependent epimerase/dehydratase family protein [Pseudalkalibacillus caeni]TLS37471.1 NAD-dependent epimerase/dehydratase family protein [Pseudalkalibacillus caeni]
MKILVTGGAGFIGSHVVDTLKGKGYRVVVLDNLSTGRKQNISTEVPFYNTDIKQPSLESIFKAEKPDIVIHQAAQVSVKKSVENPMLDCEENVLATINILKCCRRYHVRKVIFASSAAVYGIPQSLPIEENHALRPISFYGLSKRTSEEYIQLFHRHYGLNYSILRYSNVYGERQNLHGEAGVVTLFLNNIASQKGLTIYGDGTQTRDFINVKDVAQANVLAVDNGDNQIFNISSNISTTINDLKNELMKHRGEETPILYKEPRPGDIEHSCLSNKKAIAQLSWFPQYTLSRGLEELVKMM